MPTFYATIQAVLHDARQTAYRTVNFAMVEAYWRIGYLIVEEEQQGNNRAEYGSGLIKYLAQRLTDEFGKGFNETSLKYMRLIYQAFPIRHTLRDELTWSHYRLLSKIENEKARVWYMQEAADEQWSSRALDRQINSFYYERLLSTQEANRTHIRQEARAKTQPLLFEPKDVLKDPYILEFLNLKPNWTAYEKDLEQALLDNLQTFMLELGKGFAFVGRQQRVVADNESFRIDLVFYNYILHCFVLVDLKMRKADASGCRTNGHVSSECTKNLHKQPGDNPTIGLILCAEKNETVVKYSVLNGSQQLFASRYKLFLPSEAELKAEIERDVRFIEQNRLTK